MLRAKAWSAALLIAALTLLQLPLPARAASPFAATYAATVPAQLAAGASVTIAVTLTNTGTQAWNAAGANPVNLAYHWYDAAGSVVVWDGARTGLGADVAPGATRTLNASVAAPAKTGSYQFRFALVKEGVTWFDPEPQPRTVSVVAAYAASFANVQLPRFVADQTAAVALTVTNTGATTWNAAGANPVNLSYHWLDATGRVLVWDGLRTSLGGDLAPGAARSLSAAVRAPNVFGTYTLALELVKEGVAWFGAPHRAGATVEAVRYAATYSLGSATSLGFIGETKTFAVAVTNAGNVTWNAAGPNPVNLSYHLYDAAGRLVRWDGLRTPLGADTAPGQSRSLNLQVALPTRPGSYSLRIDLVREGIGWFSDLGVPAAPLAIQVDTGYNVGYGADTTPSAIATGAVIPISIELFNTGKRTWPAAGPNPVRLSYHLYDAFGRVVVWDGARGLLAQDVAPGASAWVTVNAAAPTAQGSYSMTLDLVQEGVTWFSDAGIVGKTKQFSVFPGVTIYGKGWGHGVGLSQWGAQGWATGAAGAPLNGEQIVQRYFPGAVFSPIEQKPFRVLLSWPSTGCNARTVSDLAQLRSDGAMQVMKAVTGAVIMTAQPTQTIRVSVSGGILRVLDEATGRLVYSGIEDMALVPVDPAKPITVVQKSRFYRGTLGFYVAGPSNLRVVNWVMPDDYTKGAVPAEMPSGWHLEAYKAQAYAARTYAAWRASAMKDRPYDLRDDASDQCYGGASVETTLGNAATAASAGKILTYQGAIIRAYYASSSGGAVERDGCVWNLVRVGGTWTCGASQPYLQVVNDPADLSAADPRGPNPHRQWVRTFQAWEIRQAVLNMAGIDIGAFISIDLENRGASGHVVSVRVRGTGATVDLRGDDFLRRWLALKSTMVRTTPF